MDGCIEAEALAMSWSLPAAQLSWCYWALRDNWSMVKLLLHQKLHLCRAVVVPMVTVSN